MRVVDAHTHAWGADTPELPWVAEVLPPGWEGPYTHEQLVADMDRAGVDEAVVVTTPLYGRGPRANEYTMRAIEAHPDRLYGVAITDFFRDDPDATRAALRRVVGHDRVLGVRMHAALAYEEIPTELDRTGDWILDDDLEPVWAEAAALDACVFVFPKAEQLSMVAELAEAHPDVSIVVDHMAWPDERTAPDEAPWADFSRVAEYANTYVKVSAVPRSAEGPWPYPDAQAYLRRLLEWFGPERLLAGSDYPWMDGWAPYADCLDWLDVAECCSRRDRAFLRYRTFDRLHG